MQINSLFNGLVSYGKAEAKAKAKVLIASAAVGLVACASNPLDATGVVAGKPPEVFRCEYGIEFSARFEGNGVTLDGSRGYDVLFKDTKGNTNPANLQLTPLEYSNPRMNATFNLGVTGREAVLRYPLLPLVARCVRQ
jgi:hypothetical protein